MRLIESLRLGGGEKARRYLDGVSATPAARAATVTIATSSLQFEDLSLGIGRGGDSPGSPDRCG